MTANKSPLAADEYRAALAAWYEVNGRHDLPWRQARDPYAVLVSELMLQQTQVDRVIPYYLAWLARWPDVASLAAAEPADVIRAWAGLGYNRRALYLHRMAETVVRDHEGKLPDDETALRALPGIGPYTARAVACFALEQRTAPADTNIARVIARSRLGFASQKSCTTGEIDTAALELLPGSGARDHNLSLMDLGALVCGAKTPVCMLCPLATGCAWRLAGMPDSTTRSRTLPKFETTARFARGRIIDRLREGPATDDELASMLPPPHNERTGEYLTSLLRDGLVERNGDLWRLPGRNSTAG